MRSSEMLEILCTLQI